MKLSEILEKLDRSDSKKYCDDFYEIRRSLDLDSYEDNYIHSQDYSNPALHYFWLESWLCTDTHVGTRVYFLEDEAVAVSQQESRKCDENFYFVRENVGKLYDFLSKLKPVEAKVLEGDIHLDYDVPFLGNSEEKYYEKFV